MDLIAKLERTFIPQVAIIVYRSSMKDDDYDDAPSGDYYLESHQLDSEGRVLEGKPLQVDTIQGMVEVMMNQQKDRALLMGSIPEILLQYKPLPAGKYRLVWYRPAEIRYIHFERHLKLNSGKMWFPGLVYEVDRENLKVYAFKKAERPGVGIKLYRAPFHNVSDDGSVCLGDARVKRPSDNSYESAVRYWEDLFWRSKFSHLNGASNPTKSSLTEVYKKLLASDTKKKWSDLDELKETKKAMKTILS
jgi:PRTRC genetic system protein B